MKYLTSVAVLAAILAVPAMGQWADDFQSYPLNSPLVGQGGWAGWDGGPALAIVSDDHPKFAGDQAAKLFQNDDCIQEHSGYTTGQFTYTAMQYIPDTLQGVADMQTYFILMNKYTLDSKGWSVQLQFDLENSICQDDEDPGDPGVPIIYNAWNEIRVDIDLEANTQATFYNGIPVGTADWYEPANPDHAKAVAAVDLWADIGGDPVYYDDMSLVPEPASLCLLVLTGLFLRRR